MALIGPESTGNLNHNLKTEIILYKHLSDYYERKTQMISSDKYSVDLAFASKLSLRKTYLTNETLEDFQREFSLLELLNEI